jgi:ribosomal RNA-processing protein 12
LFLRGSVPSAKGSLGGNGAITLLLWFSGKSDLTVDAVKLHNELQSGTLSLGKSQAPETTMDQDPEVAFTEKSSGTFLSGLSDCTNVTFSKVQRFWESNSAAHKEVGDWLLSL